MKRSKLLLDQSILAEAHRLSGARTYSETVMCALEDFVRRPNLRRLLELRGSGVWEGDLTEMRSDRQARSSERQ